MRLSSTLTEAVGAGTAVVDDGTGAARCWVPVGAGQAATLVYRPAVRASAHFDGTRRVGRGKRHAASECDCACTRGRSFVPALTALQQSDTRATRSAVERMAPLCWRNTSAVTMIREFRRMQRAQSRHRNAPLQLASSRFGPCAGPVSQACQSQLGAAVAGLP